MENLDTQRAVTPDDGNIQVPEGGDHHTQTVHVPPQVTVLRGSSKEGSSLLVTADVPLHDDDDAESDERQPLMGSRRQQGAAQGQDGPAFFIDYVRPCFAEFFGTTIFVFIGTMSAVNTSNIVPVGLAHGLAIFLLVTVYGHISGGHFNPAVTTGVFLSGGMKLLQVPFYIIAQLLGGILGSALTRGVLSFSTGGTDTVYQSISGGATLCGPGVNSWEGLLAEAVLTFVLVLTVIVTAVDQGHTLAPLAIGMALGVSIMAGGNISGASLNPARSLGPSVVATDVVSGVWKYHWIYWVGPLLGALFAAADYRLVLASAERRLLFKPKRS